MTPWNLKLIRNHSPFFLLGLTASTLAVLLVWATVLSGTSLNAQSPEEEAPFDWRSDWAVDTGFSLEIDTEGYQFPTAIAFVPNPGDRPDDPLYFVTEVRGTIKVVTNDRTVHAFAGDFFPVEDASEVPFDLGEHGMGGLCLDAEHGYVFATFFYRDPTDKVFYNDIIRFETEPGTFSVTPQRQQTFSQIFAASPSANSHGIGACQVHDGLLYVSVGNAFKPEQAGSLDSTLGKVLRMTRDGKPSPENPFYQDDNSARARNYVWAYGFRNPFGMDIVDGRVFIAENGGNIDRFLEIKEGENYLHDGTDWGLGINSAAVFSPAVSPVHTEYYPAGSDLFPEEFRGRFYSALAGRQLNGGASIVAIEYSLDEKRMLSVPRHFLRYRGNEFQAVVGLGFGADGLYFAPLFPNQEGRGFVFRVKFDPVNEHPYVMGEENNPVNLIAENNCLACHSIEGVGGSAAPSLDHDELLPRLTERLHSAEYLNSLNEVDSLETEPFIDYTDARAEVAAQDGIERVRAWLRYRLLEPRFDNPQSQMPNLGLSGREADLIADYLLEENAQPLPREAPPSLLERVEDFLRSINTRLLLLLAFVGGAIAASAGFLTPRFVSKLKGN